MTVKAITKSKIDIFSVISTLFGIGFIPFMPGTFGTLAAMVVYLGIPESWLNSFPNVMFFIILISILFLLGVWFTKKAENKLGHDAGSIIWDEFVGYFVAVLFLPHSLLMGVYAFAIFRVFDIAKPFPIKQSQNFPHGWGIMIDDILAGIYTNIFMQLLLIIYPKFFLN